MFLSYIHYFRALAITYIVAGHSIDAFTWSNTDEEIWLRIFLSNGSVLFVFIAGYLFQHLSVSFNAKKYYVSKIKYVIVPYILVSIPAIAIFVFAMERETVWAGFYQNSIWEQIGWFYLTGLHLAPLWFIPMITIFYIIAPLLVKLDKSKFAYYPLPLLLLLSCFIIRGNPLTDFVHFFSAFILGMFFSKYKNEINPMISKVAPIMVALSLVFLFAAIEFRYMDGTMTYVNFLQKIAVTVFFLGVLIKFKEHLNSKLISRIADASFGIFFIHSYFLTAGKMVMSKVTGQLPGGNVFLTILATIIIVGVCFVVIIQLQKLLGRRSRFIVGS